MTAPEAPPVVHMLTILPDGSAIGFDDDNSIYRGHAAQIDYADMTVTTTIAEDGQSFDRVITLPDGSIFGHGTTTYEGWSRAARMQAALDAQDPDAPPSSDESQLQADWQAECAVDHLKPGAAPASVYLWTKE